MQETHEPQEGDETYYTVREAAARLRVAESTVWRWVDSGILPAMRMPSRRIRIEKKEVERAMTPAQAAPGRREDWRRWVIQERGAEVPLEEVLARVGELNRSILKRRAGVPLPDSVDDMREAREEWGRRHDDV